MKKLNKKHYKKIQKIVKQILIAAYFAVCKTGIAIANGISIACAIRILGIN